MILLKRLAQLAAVLPILVASIALFALMVLTFCDVILRSAFNAPIEAATELTRIAIAVIVFSALPLLSARGQHISVDLLDPIFARFRLARWRDGIVNLACGVMLYFPASRVVDLAQRARSYGDQTEYLNIPTYLIGWFIAIMSFATALVLILRGAVILFAPSKLRLIRND
ncbi:TRAP-type C4-dicarboxylate transport system, small permease component [Lutimaribacter pacificus]|uniref:TRAP transporter small permease protein n=1 Tax=Lutimaribacter pacificus TaxID=391948 RepID=A0A1H0HR22_9RHOB|nr:TRAP transporter small permease subunit [Lutimaribacter pacificus]SDO21587.1 TRAP-type C4-dicarboxylate transport system, small permease component [Lutimaribacter pacificus]SHK32306.1 TRAP-type C4-dicarboxylate transport system, small permease component [Lutimaribacter pacificus]